MTKSNLRYFIFWFFLANTIVFWVLGFNYFSAIIHSTTLFKNFLADYSSWSGQLFVLTFTVVNYASFMMLLAFIPAIPALISLLIFPRQRLILFLSILSATLGLILLFIDSQVYSMFKFHLSSALLRLTLSGETRAVFDFSSHELVLAAIFIGVVVAFECGIAWMIWSKNPVVPRLVRGIQVMWLSTLLFSYFALTLSISRQNNLLIQQAAIIPLENQLLAYTLPGQHAYDELVRYSEQHYTDALYAHDALNYPRHPMQCQLNKPYNIILIMVDSLRFDSLQLMPQITKFAENNWQFNQHLSGGNATQSGVFSLFYSLPSSYWTAALEQKKHPVLIDLLRENHYDMGVYYSAEMHNPPLDEILYRGLENLNGDGAPGEDVANWDRYTTEKALAFLQTEHTNPFFLNLFYNAPHAFCRTQNFPAIFKPITQTCSRIGMNNQTDPQPLYNNYRNAVNFIDHEIAKVLDLIEEKGYLKNSIVIFTSDHGQEFNDNKQNYWGHAGNYTATQVQVPLIIHWPNQDARAIDYRTASYDVIPTLLTRLFECKNSITDYSIGQDLLQEAGRLPFVLAGSYVNMGIIEPDRLMILEASGHINITNLKAEPMSDVKPHAVILNQALRLMRGYYQ